MYYWEESKSWHISTTRSYDNTNIVWDKKNTYENMLNTVLNEYNTNYTNFCKELDKDTCYTFGIKHVSTSMLFVCACKCAAISMCLSVLLNVCNALRIYYVA
jgi:hypothetical protein